MSNILYIDIPRVMMAGNFLLKEIARLRPMKPIVFMIVSIYEAPGSYDFGYKMRALWFSLYHAVQRFHLRSSSN